MLSRIFRWASRLLPVHSEQKNRRLGHARGPVSVMSAILFFSGLPASSAQSLGVRQSSGNQPPPDSLVLAAGDMIDVRVFDTPELSAKLRISPEGYVDLPVIGKVFVAGITPLQADKVVRDEMRDQKIMQDARVTIQVAEYATQGVSVLGEVNKPGTYVLLGRQSIFEALSAAGGVTGREGAIITITHVSDSLHPITIPFNSSDFSLVGQRSLLQPGDLVFVPRAKSVFVVGDVGHPGEFLMPNDAHLNALKAIALAQGANHNASLRKASIVRETSSGVQTIHIDLVKITESRSLDPTLEPGDVVVVPHSGAKAFLEYGLPAVAGGLTGAVAAALVYR